MNSLIINIYDKGELLHQHNESNIHIYGKMLNYYENYYLYKYYDYYKKNSNDYLLSYFEKFRYVILEIKIKKDYRLNNFEEELIKEMYKPERVLKKIEKYGYEYLDKL